MLREQNFDLENLLWRLTYYLTYEKVSEGTAYVSLLSERNHRTQSGSNLYPTQSKLFNSFNNKMQAIVRQSSMEDDLIFTIQSTTREPSDKIKVQKIVNFITLTIIIIIRKAEGGPNV